MLVYCARLEASLLVRTVIGQNRVQNGLSKERAPADYQTNSCQLSGVLLKFKYAQGPLSGASMADGTLFIPCEASRPLGSCNTPGWRSCCIRSGRRARRVRWSEGGVKEGRGPEGPAWEPTQLSSFPAIIPPSISIGGKVGGRLIGVTTSPPP